MPEIQYLKGREERRSFLWPVTIKNGERRPIALQTQILKIIKMKKLT
jgi:hypothetical protein